MKLAKKRFLQAEELRTSEIGSNQLFWRRNNFGEEIQVRLIGNWVQQIPTKGSIKGTVQPRTASAYSSSRPCCMPHRPQKPPVVWCRYRSPRLRARTLSQTQAAVGVEPPPQLKPASSRTGRKTLLPLTFRTTAPPDTHAALLLRRPLRQGPARLFFSHPPTRGDVQVRVAPLELRRFNT